ncbi:MAG TPA: acylphosphatase [Candidatus Binataceae bacterium]|nr:acylphosphatase [Candidatus Binataceae bacterium]
MVAQDLAQLHLIVTGRVQGVFFRRATADQARVLGLKGFARNCPDGSVEIVAEGKRQSLEMLLKWAGHGPPHARVDKVQPVWADFSDEFAEFSVR